jgi:hypothetical protein
MSLLLDVSPGPLVGGLIVLVIAILTVVVFLILAFVFLLKWLQRGSSPTVREGVLPQTRIGICIDA